MEQESKLENQIQKILGTPLSHEAEQVTPEDITACEKHEMDKDALEEAINAKAQDYLQDPLALLDNMGFQSKDENMVRLENTLKQMASFTTKLAPDHLYILAGLQLEACMLVEARFLAERDLEQ